MAKRDREAESESDIDVSSSEDEELKLEGSDEEMEDIVNVDFDFFNLNPDVDFHATKNFMRQMLQDDSVLFGLSELADLVLKLGNVGTTIKTEGLQSDPFSILSVINLTDNLEDKQVKLLNDYFISKSKTNPKLQMQLTNLLSAKSNKRIGMIFSERLVNMPVETMPPMYQMFIDEMKSSGDEFNFDYYLIPSRVNQILASTVDKEFEDEDESEQRKKIKKSQKGSAPLTFDYVHYEDESLEKNAVQFGYFEYTHKNVDGDGRRVFNDYAVDPKLSLILIEKSALANAVTQMADSFPH